MLAEHALIRTRELDEARDMVSRVFAPHRLELEEGRNRLDLTLNRWQGGEVGLHFVDYGAPVRIVPGELGSFYLVQIPLAGTAAVSCGRQQIMSTPVMAAVPNPIEPLDMRWADGTPQLVVYLPRAKVEKALRDLLHRDVTVPLIFHLGFDLDSARGRAWRALLEPLLLGAQGDRSDLHPAVRAQVEDALVMSLVASQPSNYDEAIRRDVALPASTAIRRAMRRCEEPDAHLLTLSDLADAAGLSVRALQVGFRRYAAMSPMQYLRAARLRAVHDTLMSEPGQSVSEAACRWGFSNPGRFSREYRSTFGELPSETAMRARGAMRA